MFRHKVKTLDELIAIVGLRPRKKAVIMCHGVFDIVHPGHLRHLIYAKEKADILVASITTDAHITKADRASRRRSLQLSLKILLILLMRDLHQAGGRHSLQ